MASIPVVGSVDWKWFIIGILFQKFVLGWILGLLSGARAKASAPAA